MSEPNDPGRPRVLPASPTSPASRVPSASRVSPASHVSAASRDGLSRRELLRLAGVAGLGGLGLGLAGCSAAPEQEIEETTTEPTSIQLGGVLNGSVSGLLNGESVAGATLEIPGVGTVTTDLTGSFSLRIERSGDFEVIIRAPGFFERRSAVRITGNASVLVTLIESDAEVELGESFLDQFVRGTGPNVDGRALGEDGVLTRWTSAPEIRVYRRLDGDPDTRLSDRRVDTIEAVIDNAFASFTAGALGFTPTVHVVDEAPPAARSRIPAGVLCFFQTADDSRGATHVNRLDESHAIAAAAAFSGTEATGGVLTRVFGQSLGARPVEDAMPSVMNAEGRFTFTPQDLLAARVLHGRPPGNRAPDTDPDGFFLNA